MICFKTDKEEEAIIGPVHRFDYYANKTTCGKIMEKPWKLMNDGDVTCKACKKILKKRTK